MLGVTFLPSAGKTENTKAKNKHKQDRLGTNRSRMDERNEGRNI